MKRRDFVKLVFGALSPFVVQLKPKEAYSRFSQPFISLCNLAISHEYGAIVQYINHSGLIPDSNIKSILERNMQDEIVHARKLTEILVKEGASPTVSIWPPQTGKGLKKLIEEDIEGENAAIKLYSQILDLPESKKYRDVIYSFMKREEVHRSRLVEIMSAVRKSKT